MADELSQDPDAKDQISLRNKELLDTMPPELKEHQDQIGQPSKWQRLAKRLGRRGMALILFGVMYVLSGAPLLIQPARITLHVYELRVWAAAFIAAGVVSWVSAFRRHARHDKAGFLALMVIGWLWVAYCALSSILHVFNPLIFPNLVSLTFQDALLMILVLVTSGWPEPFEPVDLAHTLSLRSRPNPEDHENAE